MSVYVYIFIYLCHFFTKAFRVFLIKDFFFKTQSVQIVKIKIPKDCVKGVLRLFCKTQTEDSCYL